MTVKELANMMNPEVEVKLKDSETGKIYFTGKTVEIVKNNFCDEVADWDFSHATGNVIYIK